MATQLDQAVEEALRRCAAQLRRDGEWLELIAPLPSHAAAAYSDLLALRVNSYLRGPTTVARQFGERGPYMKAETWCAPATDQSDFVHRACAGMAMALDYFTTLQRGSSRLPDEMKPRECCAVAEVVHACTASGWPPTSNDHVRVELPTRAGVFTADLNCDLPGFTVELADLSARPDVCRRAVAALLMAVSGSFRLIRGGLLERDGRELAVLLAPLDRVDLRTVDAALSALAVACHACARETQALLEVRLAADYIARSEGAPDGKTPSTREELCLQ